MGLRKVGSLVALLDYKRLVAFIRMIVGVVHDCHRADGESGDPCLNLLKRRCEANELLKIEREKV